MNFEGCKRKFDIYAYITKVEEQCKNETNPFK